MKKLLLGLGTLSLATLPIVALVSCSSDTRTIMKGSLKAGEVTVGDITTAISAIEVYQTAETTTPDSGDKNALIVALNLKLFQGLEVADLPNYEIKFDNKNPGSETITLTAKSGFKFGTGTSLVSKINSIPGSLNIGEVTAKNMTDLIGSIERYQELPIPSDEEKNTLTNDLNYKVFSDLEKSDLTNFVIKFDKTVGKETITLTAKSGIKFGTSATLIGKAKAADTILNGSLKAGDVTTVDMNITIAAIVAYQTAETTNAGSGDKTTLIAALNLKSFEALTVANLPNYEIKFDNENPGAETITLTANLGFVFTEGKELISKVNMNIIPGALKATKVYTADIKTTIAAIEVYKQIQTATDEDKTALITALNKTSFNNLTIEDLIYYDISVNDSILGIESITLQIKSGNANVKFETGAQELVSKAIGLIPVTLRPEGITAPDLKNTISAIQAWEGNAGLLGVMIQSLNLKAFSGITIQNFNNTFTIKYNNTAGSESITLTARDGYEFAGEALTLVSSV